MYLANKVFCQPPDDGVSVWRYMDFTKYVALLATKTLFFARADKLGDPFEGSFTQPSLESRIAFVKQQQVTRPHMEPLLGSVWRIGARRKTMSVAVTCWHMNEIESTAMWSLYLRSNEGIAIRSTYSRLRDSFRTTDDVHLGVVNYLDYARDSFPTIDQLEPFVHKRKSFKHEQEVRAIVVVEGVGPGVLNPLNSDWKPGIESGVSVPVALDTLIESIFLPPTATDWFRNLVGTVQRQFGFNFPVHQSALIGSPLY